MDTTQPMFKLAQRQTERELSAAQYALSAAQELLAEAQKEYDRYHPEEPTANDEGGNYE